jgi:hypothetical protein
MRGWIVGMALGLGGFFGCVDRDPSETPTAIETPLGGEVGGTDLAPRTPAIQGETIQRAEPEPDGS